MSANGFFLFEQHSKIAYIAASNPRYRRNRVMPSILLAIIVIIGLLCHAMSRFRLIRAAACGGGDFGTSKSLITRDCFYPGV